ncbi:hypothetical protein Tco_0269813 [Tanacetum coccineum]
MSQIQTLKTSAFLSTEVRGSTLKQSTVTSTYPKDITQAILEQGAYCSNVFLTQMISYDKGKFLEEDRKISIVLKHKEWDYFDKRIVAIEDSNSKALVATDNNEDIDWTKEFDAEPVTYAMMALTGFEQDDWSIEFDAEHMHFGQDGLDDFDWSNKADDAPISLALMATNSEVTDESYYPRMDSRRPRISSYSPSSRSSTTRTPHRPQRPKKVVKSIWVKKGSTVGSQAVLPQTVKKSAMISPKQTWKPKGNYLDSVNRVRASRGGSQGAMLSLTVDAWKYRQETRAKVVTDFKEFKGGDVAFGNDSNKGDGSQEKEPLRHHLGSKEYYFPRGWIHLFGCKAIEDEVFLWHRRPGALSTCVKNINNLVERQLVRGLLQRHSKLDHLVWHDSTANGVAEESMDFIDDARTMLADFPSTYSILEEKRRNNLFQREKKHVDSTFTLSTANTPPQSTGNTPTDSDDDTPTDGVFSTNSFDAEEGGVADYNNLDPTIDVPLLPTPL